MNMIRHHVGTGPHDDTGLRALCGKRLGHNDGHIGVWNLNRDRRVSACGHCLAILVPPRRRREVASAEVGDDISALREQLTGYVGGKRRRRTVVAA